MFSTTKEQNRSFCLYCFLIISNNQRLIRGSREVNKAASSRLSDDSIVAGAGGGCTGKEICIKVIFVLLSPKCAKRTKNKPELTCYFTVTTRSSYVVFGV